MTYPIAFGLRGLPPDAPTWGAEYKRTAQRKLHAHGERALVHTTSLSVESNNITLDPHVKGRLGLAGGARDL